MKGPVRKIPSALYDAFTMNRTCAVYDLYFDHSTPSITTSNWTNDFVQSFLDRFTVNNIKKKLHGKEDYNNGAIYHVISIEKYPIKYKNVAVIGSITPWIEAILLNCGAAHVTTVEYNVPICNNDKITTISYEDFTKSLTKYDAIFSYSSIEHSGLGRYGDHLNPNGDLEAMSHIRNKLVDNGLLYLGVPVGKDAISWNAHRVYGPKRLKLLTTGFTDLEWIGEKRSYITSCAAKKNGPQPIMILKKKS